MKMSLRSESWSSRRMDRVSGSGQPIKAWFFIKPLLYLCE